MKTTVIIPNYNGKNFLKKCLETATGGMVNASVVVVDNGSSDGSREWIAQHYPDVSLIAFPENRGFCAAVNAGIKAADTPYVFLLNNDTAVEPDCIQRLEEVMDKNPRLFSAGAKMLSMKNPNEVDTAGDLYSAFGWAFAIGKGHPSDRYEKSLRVFSNCAGAAIYRREYLKRTGLFDEAHFAYLEDVDLGWRARILGFWNVTVPAAKVYHAGSGSSGSRHNDFKVYWSARNSLYLAYKNMPPAQLLCNLFFLAAGLLIKAAFFTAKGYGRAYAKGLADGFNLCLSVDGKKKRVRFQKKYWYNYVEIQLELWLNLFRRF